ncbi:MAG TPA: ABC transporter permease [Candidatus Paceibacterota bacterium]|nr:ABC transporter permease [Candidatus Paceibacterota bacterium]
MFERLKGVLLQEYFISVRSLEVWFDMVFFPLVTTVVFGFVAKYLSGENLLAASYLLLGLLLWHVLQVSQYSMSMGVLWNVWSRNLSNMFITPLSIKEYIIAETISSLIKSLGMSLVLSFTVYVVFGFDVLQIGLLNYLLYFINLSLFAWAVGIVLVGVIFKYGTRIQALAWSIIFLFQPLTAAFFPVSVLPSGIRELAFAFPPTYIFEAARGNILDASLNLQYVGIAFILNIVYFVFALAVFHWMFKKSKETGQFARNEG